MLAILLHDLASLASSSALLAAEDDGGPAWLLILGPAGGGAVYFFSWRYYRNTDKSHSFERETRIVAQPITGDDDKVNEIKGTKKSGIDGDNSSNHRQRVQRVD
jgi:hypothetical protein